MSTNLTIESPNVEKIGQEAGQYTASAILTLWEALNDTRAVERRDFRRASDMLAPAFLTVDAGASVNNLDLQGASVISFIGSTDQNFTGIRAPETGQSRLVFVQVSGTGTITSKQEATSEAANRLTHSAGTDVALTTAKGLVYVYLASRWRQVAL